jgi:hypothetical protein
MECGVNMGTKPLWKVWAVRIDNEELKEVITLYERHAPDGREWCDDLLARACLDLRDARAEIEELHRAVNNLQNASNRALFALESLGWYVDKNGEHYAVTTLRAGLNGKDIEPL